MGTVSPVAGGCPDWRASWTQLVGRERPDVVAVLLGRWECLDRLFDGSLDRCRGTSLRPAPRRRARPGHRHRVRPRCEGGDADASLHRADHRTARRVTLGHQPPLPDERLQRRRPRPRSPSTLTRPPSSTSTSCSIPRATTPPTSTGSGSGPCTITRRRPAGSCSGAPSSRCSSTSGSRPTAPTPHGCRDRIPPPERRLRAPGGTGVSTTSPSRWCQSGAVHHVLRQPQ